MIDNYYSNTRSDLLDLIPDSLKSGKLLEIGAGAGQTLLYAKQHGYASEIHGIELCDLMTTEQKSQFDSFSIGNVESMELSFASDYFDVIICGDVLEHLIDPYALVTRIKKHLKPNGVVIASIPNIRNWDILKQIIFHGDFRYEDAGILDRTHLRFFCKKNAIELFTNNGYQIVNISTNLSMKLTNFRRRARYFFYNLLTFGHYADFKAVQYFIVVSKA